MFGGFYLFCFVLVVWFLFVCFVWLLGIKTLENLGPSQSPCPFIFQVQSATQQALVTHSRAELAGSVGGALTRKKSIAHVTLEPACDVSSVSYLAALSQRLRPQTDLVGSHMTWFFSVITLMFPSKRKVLVRCSQPVSTWSPFNRGDKSQNLVKSELNRWGLEEGAQL